MVARRTSNAKDLVGSIPTYRTKKSRIGLMVELDIANVTERFRLPHLAPNYENDK